MKTMSSYFCSIETAWNDTGTVLRRSPVSSALSVCTRCCQQGHAGSKTLLQHNPPVLNWGWWLTELNRLMATHFLVCYIYVARKKLLLDASMCPSVNFKLFYVDWSHIKGRWQNLYIILSALVTYCTQVEWCARFCYCVGLFFEFCILI